MWIKPRDLKGVLTPGYLARGGQWSQSPGILHQILNERLEKKAFLNQILQTFFLLGGCKSLLKNKEKFYAYLIKVIIYQERFYHSVLLLSRVLQLASCIKPCSWHHKGNMLSKSKPEKCPGFNNTKLCDLPIFNY